MNSICVEGSNLGTVDTTGGSPRAQTRSGACPGCAYIKCGCTRGRTGKAGEPETLSMARTWDWVKGTYVKDGFCHSCAAQAAYGHQLGFSQIDPPCEDCRGTPPSYAWAGERARRWAGLPHLVAIDSAPGDSSIEESAPGTEETTEGFPWVQIAPYAGGAA